jgi:cysteinyl-tRNA synthetase
MSQRHLGQHIDIHGGGTDLIFPHHENEIAQSEAACPGAPFARYWLHNGLLQLGDEKMSKSLGNIVRIADFLDAHEPEAFRLFVLSSHYRRPVTLSDESIGAAERGLERLRGALRPAHAGGSPRPDDLAALAEAAATAEAVFQAEMADDFGTPGALAALFNLVTAINRARDAGVAGPPFEAAQATLVELAGVLGFRLREGYARTAGAHAADAFISLLVELREEARASKDWSRADRIRDRLAALGVQLEDSPGGTGWRWGPSSPLG